MKSLPFIVALVLAWACLIGGERICASQGRSDGADRWRWARQAWTGDDAAMRSERDRIAAIGQDERRLGEVVAEASATFRKTKTRFALFQWASAQRYLTA